VKLVKRNRQGKASNFEAAYEITSAVRSFVKR